MHKTFCLLSLCLFACIDDPQRRVVTTVDDAVPAAGIDVIELTTDRGPVSVIGDPSTEELSVSFELLSKRRSSDDDDGASDALHVELRETEDGRVRASAWLDDDYEHYEIGIVARIPLSVEAEIDADEGDVSVEGVGTTSIVNDRGDIDVTDLRGWLVIDDGEGDIDVHQVEGDVDINDGDGDIRVIDVTGTVAIWDGEGDIEVRGAGDARVLSDEGGDVSIE